MALILARSGGTQYIPQMLLGNLKILYIIVLLFPWSHSFFLPKLGGYLQGKADITQSLSVLQQSNAPLMPGLPFPFSDLHFRQDKFLLGGIFHFKNKGRKHSEMKPGGNQMLLECDSGQKILFPWQDVGREAALHRFLQSPQGLAAATSTWQGPPAPHHTFPGH